MSSLRTLALAIAVLMLAGCAVPFGTQLVPSGPLVTQDFDLANFSAVAAGSAFQVEITQSDSYSVSVTVNENLVERLDVGVSGNTLRISLKPGIGLAGAATLKAKVDHAQTDRPRSERREPHDPGRVRFQRTR